MLYWQIEHELQIELEQAIARFRIRYGSEPSLLLVNKEEEVEFVKIKNGLNIKTDKYMSKNHFGLL